MLFSRIFSGIVAWLSEPDDIAIPPLTFTPGVPSSNTRILIVGAGTAGLFAGYTLEYFNHTNFEILEASGTFGGRVAEDTTYLDVPIDLGAEWVHGKSDVLDDLLLFKENLPTVTVETISYQPQTYYFHGSFWLFRRLKLFRLFYRETKFKDTTWFQYLRDFIRSRIHDDKLILETPVTTIDTSDPAIIRVTTTDGTVRTVDKVIVAVPLSILQSGTLSFSPALPSSKQEALDNTVCHKGMKVWMEFDHKFYTDLASESSLRDLFSSASSGEIGGVFIDALFRKPSTKYVIMYVEVTKDAEALLQMSDDDLVQKLLSDLDSFFGSGVATGAFLSHRIQRWDESNPYIQCGYSNAWNGDQEALVVTLAEPVADGRVLFCGEHTNYPHTSTVHGAAISGRQAAEQALS